MPVPFKFRDAVTPCKLCSMDTGGYLWIVVKESTNHVKEVISGWSSQRNTILESTFWIQQQTIKRNLCGVVKLTKVTIQKWQKTLQISWVSLVD
jgi:hypothetical protein